RQCGRRGRILAADAAVDDARIHGRRPRLRDRHAGLADQNAEGLTSSRAGARSIRSARARRAPEPAILSRVAFANVTMSAVAMTMAAAGAPALGAATKRRRRLIRPALGFVLPVTLALAWEIVVHMGWASGR